MMGKNLIYYCGIPRLGAQFMVVFGASPKGLVHIHGEENFLHLHQQAK